MTIKEDRIENKFLTDCPLTFNVARCLAFPPPHSLLQNKMKSLAIPMVYNFTDPNGKFHRVRKFFTDIQMQSFRQKKPV